MDQASDGESTPPAKRQKAGGWSPVNKVPPAPPSTPASLGRILNETLSDPIVTCSIQNAAALEQAQRMQESATPMPTPKPHKSMTISDDFSEWAVGERYQLVRLLGRGSYGEVAQAKDRLTQDLVAIKRITSAFEQEVDAVRLYREIHILRRLRGHECIINLIDVVQPVNLEEFKDLYLVFECKSIFRAGTLLPPSILLLTPVLADVDTDLYKLIMSPQYLTTQHIQVSNSFS